MPAALALPANGCGLQRQWTWRVVATEERDSPDIKMACRRLLNIAQMHLHEAS